MLSIPFVQRKAAEAATAELSNRLGVQVTIGQIDIDWFNSLVLEDVYLADQHGETLFEASHLSAGFEVLPLLKKKLVFTTVRLFGFSFHLSKETPESQTNLQFVIDAFSSKDTTKTNPNIDFQINSILIRRGNFSYDVLSENQTPEKFNAKHIDLKNITAKISLRSFNKDSLNASISRLSLDEQSGIKLQRFALHVAGNKDSATVSNLEIALPQTDFKIAQARIHFVRTDSLQQFFDEAPVDLVISPSKIGLQDLKAFVPAFKNFTDPVELSGTATGFINDIHLTEFTTNYNNHKIFLNANANLKNITTPKSAYIHGQVSNLHITEGGLSRIINNFHEKPLTLPEQVARLGDLDFNGEISGFFDNLVTYGELRSSIGSLQTDLIIGRNDEKKIAFYVKGKLSTSELQIDRLFDEGNPYGKVQLTMEVDAKQPKGGSLAGAVKAAINKLNFKGYEYNNILISGNFKKNEFDGLIDMNDPNGKLQAEGIFRSQQDQSFFNFKARVADFHPDKLNLLQKYESPDIAFSLTADFTGNNIDNLEGSIQVDSLSFKTDPGEFFLKQLIVDASGHSDDRRLSIRSDLINGEVNGAYSFSTIATSLINTSKQYLPTLIESKEFKEETEDPNNFALELTVQNTEQLSKTLKLPVTIVNQFRLVGEYNNQLNKFRFEAFMPKFRVQHNMFESGYLMLENQQDKATVHVKAANTNEKGMQNYFDIKGEAAADKITSFMSWANNNNQHTYKADLATSALFSKETIEGKKKPQLRTDIVLGESSLVINDSIWNVNPASIVIRNGDVKIDNIYLSRNEQFLRIDGVISNNAYETLAVELKDIELSYIFDMINIDAVKFGGKATGTFNLNDLYHSRIINTDLEVEHFAFHQAEVGRLNLFSEWDNEQQGILMLGTIYKNDTTFTDVNGYIYPVGEKSGLSLYFDANDIDVGFLRHFVESVAQNFQGRGFGHVHVFGPFSEITVEGDAYIKDGGFGIEFTNAYYTFSDSVHMTPTSITGRNLTLYDSEGNKAVANARVTHNSFEDIAFNISVLADNLIVYDVPQKLNPQIHGKVYGSGTAVIKGNEKLVDLDLTMQSRPNTMVYLNFMDGSTAEEYDFVQFVNKDTINQNANDSTGNGRSFLNNLVDTETEIRMNLNLDVTPDAKIQFMMDPAAGDKITGTGSGNLQVQYGTRTPLQMYGGLTIVNGNYDFSMQQIIHKDFKIREGSALTFRGDPYDAILDINAIYNVTANLGDLDQSLLIESARTNIPVNCVLLIEGRLQNPAISFNLELPNSTKELEQKVRSFIDTDDMMTRQIVYLLVLNKFYTPDYSKNTRSSSEFTAVASSAVSSQLSDILSSFTDKVQIGTNIRASEDGVTDTEVEMLLSSQLLDNRLLINGNFGYKNNAFQQSAFIGEFDLEYKLTRLGDIRLKAYNHANDMYRYKQTALTKQGIGIMYRRDFTDISELFHRRKRTTPLYIPPDTTSVSRRDTVRPLPKDTVVTAPLK